jgi:hypothetical protein
MPNNAPIPALVLDFPAVTVLLHSTAYVMAYNKFVPDSPSTRWTPPRDGDVRMAADLLEDEYWDAYYARARSSRPETLIAFMNGLIASRQWAVDESARKGVEASEHNHRVIWWLKAGRNTMAVAKLACDLEVVFCGGFVATVIHEGGMAIVKHWEDAHTSKVVLAADFAKKSASSLIEEEEPKELKLSVSGEKAAASRLQHESTRYAKLFQKRPTAKLATQIQEKSMKAERAALAASYKTGAKTVFKGLHVLCVADGAYEAFADFYKATWGADHPQKGGAAR